MIRAAVRWFRPVMPPGWVVGLFVFVYACWDGFHLWVVYGLGLPDDVEGLVRVRCLIATLGALGYAVFRVWSLHPLFRADYRRWLEQTPWTSRKPLPAGPVHLVLQDLVVLAILVLAADGFGPAAVLVPTLFLAAYLFVVCISFWVTGPWWMGYALAFGMGLVVRLAPVPAAAVALLVLLYPLAFFGLRLALARFPWQIPEAWESLTGAYRSKHQLGRRSVLGWPWDSLRAGQAGALLSRPHTLVAPLLAGWWAYVITAIVPDPELHRTLPIAFLVGAVVISWIGRLAAYVPGHYPPISLWGRVLTGRWILPGYDHVLVAPILTILVGIAGPLAASWLGSPDIVMPIAVAAVLLVALNVGPSLPRWRLTARCRMGPVSTAGQEVVRL